MIPLSVDRPFSTKPWVNQTLIAVNILVFLIGGILPQEAQTWVMLQFNLWPTAQVATNNGLIATPHLWQFITSTFLHGGFWHITGNMLFLWVFGNVVEDKLGHFRYLLFYLAGGIFSGIGHVLTSSNPALGASGAVAAVMGAFLIFFPRTNIRVLWLIFLISIFEIPSIWFIGFFIAQNIWMQLQPGNHGVAYMAHLAGTFTGITVASLLLLFRMYAREPYDFISLISMWNRRRQFHAVTRRGFDPWHGKNPGKPSAFKNTSDKTINTRNMIRNNRTQPVDTPPDPASLKLSALRQTVHENIAAGKMTEAANSYNILNKEFPEALLNENDQLALANHAFAQQEYQTAEKMYRALLENFPTADLHGEVRLMLGLTLARYLNKPQEAEPFLQEAVKRLPKGDNAQLAASLLEEIH